MIQLRHENCGGRVNVGGGMIHCEKCASYQVAPATLPMPVPKDAKPEQAPSVARPLMVPVREGEDLMLWCQLIEQRLDALEKGAAS